MKVLGFDIGIRSIGWCLQENGEIIACGVRIPRSVEDAQTKESLAAQRGAARRIRRTIARKKGRMESLKIMICKEFGLNLADYYSKDGDLPKAYAGENFKSPYELRSKALTEKLSADELARVILHIAKHRGYGNKHARKESDKDKGKVLSAIKNNEQALKKYQSVGAYLYKEFYQKQRSSEEIQTKVELLKAFYDKNKIKTEKQDKNKLEQQSPNQYKKVRNTTDVYERCMKQEWLQAELELIFEKQHKFGLKFSDEFKDEILKVMFFQRSLENSADKVGFCTFFPDEKRAPKDSLSGIEYVALGKIINELNTLRKR